MAETVEHRDAMIYAIQAAQECLVDIADVWVSGNDYVYYKKDAPKKRVSPDCYIVLGVPRQERRSFKVWEENGRTPNLAIEFTSRSTAREDRETKFDLYQDVLKIEEYLLFDPLNEYMRPRLQAYRLVNGVYQSIAPSADGHILSQQTGIRFFAEGKLLRFIHPGTGQVVLTRNEARDAIQAAETEIEKLKAELQRLQAEKP